MNSSIALTDFERAALVEAVQLAQLHFVAEHGSESTVLERVHRKLEPEMVPA
ncbi:hypothetical protein [Microbacterium sp.]|uniref:hypothetical protein n=1 Tax=Microbacterium sp. TaxID=51671 RepID=UPI003F9BB96A